ncbi:hypothetical protein BDR06DRAFT_954451, partial [Suillus hirtellus]
MSSALWREIPEHVYASWDPEYQEMGDDGMFLDSDNASSFEESKPTILTHAAAAKLKHGRESSVEIVSDIESKPSIKKMKGMYISPVVLSLLHCSSRHHSEAGGLGVGFPSTECFSCSLAA